MRRLVVALVSLIALTGAGVVAAYVLLFSAGTDQAARLVPADALAYANVYLRPSTGQQMNLAGLLGRFPGFADEASLDTKVDQVVQNLLAETGLDYRDGIKPWLGDQLAVAILPADDEAPDGEPLVLAEVDDPELASASIGELASEGGGSVDVRDYGGVQLQVTTDLTYALVDEILVLGPTPASVQAAIDVREGSEALAGREDFRRTMAEMPADHLAAAFIDLAALAEATDVGGGMEGATTAGVVLVAEPDGLRLTASAPLRVEDDSPTASPARSSVSEPSTLVDWMPESTVAEAVVFGLRDTLEAAERAAAATPQGEDVAGTLDTLRALTAFGLGVDLDADILPLIEREVAVAVTGFEGPLPTGLLLLRPDDPDAAAEALGRLAEALGRLGAESTTEPIDQRTVTVLQIPDVGEVAYTVDQGVAIVGLGAGSVAAALEARDAGTSLSETDAYRRAWAVAGERAGTEAWVDVGRVLPLLGEAVPTEGDARDMLDQLGAVGISVPARPDRIEIHAGLTVDQTDPD